MRKFKNIALKILTYMFSSLNFIILITLLFFIFKKGIGLVSLDLIKGDYYNQTFILHTDKNTTLNNLDYKPSDDEYYSSKWGVSFKDSENKVGEKVVIISYIHPKSIFNNLINNSDETIKVEQGYIFQTAILNNNTAFSKYGAKEVRDTFDNATSINNMTLITEGGGIRGSIIATLLMIFFTLLLSLPLGILTAIYLQEFSKENKLTRLIRSSIELLSGIPSIIFGMVGAILFIPFTNKLINSNGGNIISGSLTLTIMLLPIIIRTTEESLKVIPKDFREQSYALGANKVQTILKIVLPNALGGILSATIMAISRIIGESAALIFAVGTSIKDKVRLNDTATTLAVHIWSIMGGESPNYELASAISIIILIIVLFLNILSKILVKRLRRNI